MVKKAGTWVLAPPVPDRANRKPHVSSVLSFLSSKLGLINFTSLVNKIIYMEKLY